MSFECCSVHRSASGAATSALVVSGRGFKLIHESDVLLQPSAHVMYSSPSTARLNRLFDFILDAGFIKVLPSKPARNVSLCRGREQLAARAFILRSKPGVISGGTFDVQCKY